MQKQALIGWIQAKDGQIRKDTLMEEWPDFERKYGSSLAGLTVDIDDDGEPLYSKEQLLKVI